MEKEIDIRRCLPKTNLRTEVPATSAPRMKRKFGFLGCLSGC